MQFLRWAGCKIKTFDSFILRSGQFVEVFRRNATTQLLIFRSVGLLVWGGRAGTYKSIAKHARTHARYGT